MFFKKRRLKKNQVPLKQRIKEIMFSSGGFPIFATMFTLAVALLVVRMKSIDAEYKINESEKTLTELKQENKEYKAKMANILSVESLRRMAAENELNPPAQNQVIVISE